MTKNNNLIFPGMGTSLKYPLLFLLLIFFLCGSYQSFSQQRHSDLEYGLLNSGVGALIGGIGAIFNKTKNERSEEVFVKGFLQGGLGGALVFESKYLLKDIRRNSTYRMVYPSKILDAAGNSIIENAAKNKNFWVQWHINFGFNRFDFYTGKEFRFRYRIITFSLLTTINSFALYDFNINRTLKLGTPVFTTYNLKSKNNLLKTGSASSNVVVFSHIIPHYGIEAHELIHVYQYEQFSGVNNFLDPSFQKLSKKSSVFSFYDRWFYTDFNFAIPVANLFSSSYRKNILENEAYDLN